MPTRTNTHFPFAHRASGAAIASTAMAPDTLMLAKASVFDVQALLGFDPMVSADYPSDSIPCFHIVLADITPSFSP